MHGRNEPRVRRTVLAAALAAVALVASFGTIAHAEDDPVADAPMEAGDDVVVAVAAPPVPPTSVVVAVGAPPVPPTSVVVAVGAPPVPPTSVVVAPPVSPTSVVVAVAPPPVPPTKVVMAPRVRSYASARSQQLADVERITDVIVDVAATVHAGLALIDSRL